MRRSRADGPVADRLPSEHRLVELLSRCARQEHHALGELYDLTVPMTYRVALCVLGDREAAGQATVETYVEVWRQSRRGPPSGVSVAAWVLAIVFRKALAVRRASPPARPAVERGGGRIRAAGP